MQSSWKLTPGIGTPYRSDGTECLHFAGRSIADETRREWGPVPVTGLRDQAAEGGAAIVYQVSVSSPYLYPVMWKK